MTHDGLLERVARRAADAGGRIALTTPGAEREALSWAGLWDESGRRAAALRAHGVRRGERVGVAMASRPETVATVVALLRAGCTLVPLLDAPPAAGWGAPAALRAAGARWCVAPDGAVPAFRDGLAAAGAEARVLPLEALAGDAPADAAPGPADALAPAERMLVQFSSGSTARPRGVCLTRANVEANLAAITERLRAGEGDVAVSWLPLYHDMGLIGALLGALWSGTALVLLRPADFIRNPLRWIEALARHRATVTMGPQFAYSLCVARAAGPAARQRLAGLDLSPLRVALNGSETVHPELSRRFTERFGELGLGPHVLQPAYGLAENCVAVTLREPGTPVPVRRLSRAALAAGRVAAPGDGDGEGDAIFLVGNGAPVRGTRVRVVDGEGRELPPGAPGEIQVAGASATAALCLEDGEAPAAAADGWVPTGDVGALLNAELYVVGRIKEIIKSGGRTFVPSDLEAALAAELADDVAGVAVFGVYDAASGSEEVVVVAELPRGAGGEGLAERVRLCVLRRFGLAVRDVVAAAPRSIPRTSSGKIQRVALRQAYVADAAAVPVEA